MKIGILTYHKGMNHGGFLQAFGLFTFLKETNHDVQIIDFANKEQQFLERRVFYLFRPWHRLWALRVKVANFMKYLKFKKTFSLFITSDKTDYSSISILSKQFDLIILGSDEIWNVENPCFPREVQVFMGESINSRRVISYAPSMGESIAENLKTSNSINLLSKLDDISVRDEHTQKEIYSVLGLEPPVLPDPTFLVDFNTIFKIKKTEGAKYILVYLNGIEINDINLIKAYAKKFSLKIISISYYQYWADENFISAGIEEWLSMFKNATCIATNTYHGLIFSFQNLKPVYIVDPSNKMNKISGLTKQFNLTELLQLKVSNIDELAAYFKVSEDLFVINHYKIQEQRLLAHNYLKFNIDEISY